MNGSQFWSLYSAYNHMYLDEGFKPTQYGSSGNIFYGRSKKAKQIDAQIENHKQRGKHSTAKVIDLLNRSADSSVGREDSRTQSERNKAKLKTRALRDAQRDEKEYRKSRIKESHDYDLYDLVLEYLLDEGLCETVENAEIMMAHMSEQWIDSIVESYRLDENTEEIARLRAQMKIALQKGDKESIKSISTRMAEIQPKAQAKIGAVLRGLKPRKR